MIYKKFGEIEDLKILAKLNPSLNSQQNSNSSNINAELFQGLSFKFFEFIAKNAMYINKWPILTSEG